MITSTKNPRIRQVLRLRRRSERDATQRFPIEGRRELGRAMDANVEIEQLVYSVPLLPDDGAALVATMRDRAVAMVEVSDEIFRGVSYRETPDGLLGIARVFPTSLDRLVLGPNPLILVVAQIEKPGNLGAMLRSAAAAGVSAVIVADPVTDVFNPNVVRASLGALFTVPVAVAETEDVVAWLREREIRILATTPEGGLPYWQTPLTGPTAIVVGSEQQGLPDRWLRAADEQVLVPMPGTHGVDSLNAASTAAILLFDVVRQRWAAPSS